jgi:hypothetical protein
VDAELLDDAAEERELAVRRRDGGIELGRHGASRGCGVSLAAGVAGAHYGMGGSAGFGPAPRTRRS